MLDNTYVKIDLDAIWNNYQAILKKAQTPVMAIIKADAYGHGAIPVARLLAPVCGFFGVATPSEALELRHAGISTPILILGNTPVEAYPQIVAADIRPAIFSLEDALALSEEAQRQQKTARFHFALDTGMSRIGFQPTQDTLNLCLQIAALPGLEVEGLFSHFATADETDLTFAREQAACFAAFDQQLRQAGLCIPIRHLNNSAGVMNFGGTYEMVRAGIVLYGLYPSTAVDPARLPLQPAMTWYSRVCHVKWLEPGRKIGYGGTYTVQKPTRVATVAAGYGDGYRRNLSNRFYILIRGQKAPILGRICMDQFMVDVTEIPDVQAGDSVVLMGWDGDAAIPAEVLGAAADSFNYEIVTGVSRRCPRFYYRGGVCVQQIDYLLD